MERDLEDASRRRPEQDERLRINSIVIPADEEYDVRKDEIGASKLADYQGVVNGLIEHVALENPPASLYVNEEGKLHGLPMNRRATLLLWVHNPAFRYADIIAGDALVTGPPDNGGHDTNVSVELLHNLLEARRFRAEVQVHGEESWHSNALRFTTWVEAYSYALDLGRRWTLVEDVRVVPEA